MSTETATPSAKTTRRYLTQAEKYNLCKWYEANAPRLLTIHDIAIAKEAEEVFGIKGLKACHMAAARDSLGIRKRKQRKEEDKDPTALEAFIAEQAADISTRRHCLTACADWRRKHAN